LEILELLPIGIIVINDQNRIVISNQFAKTLFCKSHGRLLELMASDVNLNRPRLLQAGKIDNFMQLDGGIPVVYGDVPMRALFSAIGNNSPTKGTVMILCPLERN
jgi:PAS domain-containing protein